jgi:hypothetical protein
MSPRTQIVLAVAATLIGFSILVELLIGGSFLKDPTGVFLGAMLLVGGSVFLWLRGKSVIARKSATTETNDLLSQFLKK